MISYSLLREQLGKRIAQIRMSRGLTTRQLAKILGVSQSTVSKFEKGKLNPPENVILKIADEFRLSKKEREELLESTRMATMRMQRIQFGTPGQFTHMQKIVRSLQYRNLRSFQMSLIPGLLQIRPYAEAVFRSGSNLFREQEDVQQDLRSAIEERLKQQSQLRDPDKSFTFIIHENALRHSICTPEDEQEQLHVLLRVMREYPHVRIGFLPADLSYTLEGFDIPFNGFDIMDDNLLTIELNFGWLNIWDKTLIRQYRSQFESLENFGVFRQKAIDFLKKFLAERS